MSRVLLDTSAYAAFFRDHAEVKAALQQASEETAERHAVIHDYLRRHGTPVSPNDLWIAASAAQHGLVILTLDGVFNSIPQVLAQKFELPPRH